jgi:hypothetical protein
MKKQTHAPYVLLALALLGIAVAFYDAYQLYNSEHYGVRRPLMDAMRSAIARMRGFTSCR